MTESNKAVVTSLLLAGAGCAVGFFVGTTFKSFSDKNSSPSSSTAVSPSTLPRVSTRKQSRSPVPVLPPRPTSEPDRTFYDQIKAFVDDPKQYTFTFPPTISARDRFTIHSIAELFGINHQTEDVPGSGISGEPLERLVLRKPELVEISASKPVKDQTLLLAHNQYIIQGQIGRLFRRMEQAEKKLTEGRRQRGGHRGPTSRANTGNLTEYTQTFEKLERIKGEPFVDDSEVPIPKTPEIDSNLFRFVNWNIEWMDHFFTADDLIATSNSSAGITDTNDLCTRISSVIKELNPDVLSIEEGPSSLKRMQIFCDKYLDGKYIAHGGLDGAQQRLYVLIKIGGKVTNAHIHEPSREYLAKKWSFDVDGTFEIKEYSFVRTPLVVRGEVSINDAQIPIFFLILHTKSKYVQSGESMWHSRNPATQMEYIKKSVSNRRRIAAECIRTRKCIDDIIFEEDKDALVLVAGDFNDGPGMDFFEEYYLLGDSVDALMGSVFQKKKLLTAALLEHASTHHRYTCVFDDYVDDVKNKQVLLDQIFVSPVLNTYISTCGVAHDIFNKYVLPVEQRQRKRDDHPSDHRPVFGDFDFKKSETSDCTAYPTTTTTITSPTSTTSTTITSTTSTTINSTTSPTNNSS